MSKLLGYFPEDLGRSFVTLRAPADIIARGEGSFLLCELLTIVLFCLALKHAWRNGGRLLYLFTAITLHGITTELISYFVPDIDSFWHAQSMVMLSWGRLPLHIILFYPWLIYTASIAVSRLNLKKYSEPLAVGLAVVLLDVPFDICGIKFLWWSWHDTDPNIYDRHYWVPWTSYYFHAAFASSLTFLIHFTRDVITPTGSKYETSPSRIREMIPVLLTGTLSFFVGCLQFVPISHVLHDGLGIHSEVAVVVYVAICFMFIWTDDRSRDTIRPCPRTGEKTLPPSSWFFGDEIKLIVWLHFLFYPLLMILGDPSNVHALGIHQEIGDCHHKTSMLSAFGEMSKGTYLCVSGYDEGYFTGCGPSRRIEPNPSSTVYELCGTGFSDISRAEYTVVVLGSCLFGLAVYTVLLSSRHAFSSSPLKKNKKS